MSPNCIESRKRFLNKTSSVKGWGSMLIHFVPNEFYINAADVDKGFQADVQNRRRRLASWGFKFDYVRKIYVTRDYSILAARSLQPYLSNSAKTELGRRLLKIIPWAGGLSYPKGFALEPHQVEACNFALSRNRAYLALDPGKGKTIVSAVVFNSLNTADRMDARPASALFICEAFMKDTIQEEFAKWTPFEAVDIRTAETNNMLTVCPDSVLFRPDVTERIQAWVLSQESQNHELVLFVDEAHRYKSDEAKRTRALYDEVHDLFDRVLYLSGTPMPNRPIELFSVLNKSAPEVIGFQSKHRFALQYCDAKRDTIFLKNRFGKVIKKEVWDYSGVHDTNFEALVTKMKEKFMIRMRSNTSASSDVLLVSDRLPPKVLALEKKLLVEHSPEDLMKDELKNPHYMTYRKLLGPLKAKPTAKVVNDILQNTDDKVLLFAIFTDTIDALKKELAKSRPLVITGKTPMTKRTAIVKEFQTNNKAQRRGGG
jgi:SNF2 family DNA or RNA helicase